MLSDAQRRELVAFVQRLIQAPGGPGEEGACARLVLEQMQAMGYHETHVDDWGNVVGVIRGRGRGSVLFDAHMDTVPAHPSAWQHDPFGAEVADGRIYGRGTSDMRGALAAAVYAIGQMAADPGGLGTVCVCASVAEEAVEGPALEQVCRQFSPAQVVIMESTQLGIAIGQRGRAELVIETIGKSAHSSNPWVGVNAITAMNRVIAALGQVPLGHDDLLGPAIMVVTDIMSQPYPGLSVLPHHCRITIDRRLLAGETPEGVLAQMEALLAGLAHADPAFSARVSIAEDHQPTYTGSTIVAPNFAPAWKTAPDHPLVTRAAAALREIGQAPALGKYGFCTNGSGSAGRLGIPTIGYGPGREDIAHTADEYLELDQLFRAADGYAALARALSR